MLNVHAKCFSIKSLKTLLLSRSISTSLPLKGKRNFRKFNIHNYRGTKEFKMQQKIDPHPEVPVETFGVRPTGYKIGRKFLEVPQMIPEIVVPDLTGFKLQPYISYKAPDVIQSEFTAEDLFNATYSKKIVEDYKADRLGENGNPLSPSFEENLTPEEAKINARKTGSDMF